jgi:hypothetical protein
MPTASITAAALFRSVEKWQPCLLIDEADTMFRQNDEIRTIVNSGFTRLAAVAVRCNGDNQEPRMYSVWGPKAIAKIGKLPDTIADRAIIVPLRRKAESEQAEPLRADRQNDFPLLASKLARWTLEHHERIAAQEPAIPPGLNDRQSDAWRELLRIANEAGSHWPDTARAAAVSICTRSSADDDGDIKTELLRDIRDFLAEHRAEHVSARDIVEHLVSLEGHSWPEYRDGKPITASSMTRLLKGFGIENMKKRPTTGAAPVSCFAVADFAEVFSRYLPPVPVPVQASAISGTLEQNHGNSLF